MAKFFNIFANLGRNLTATNPDSFQLISQGRLQEMCDIMEAMQLEISQKFFSQTVNKEKFSFSNY